MNGYRKLSRKTITLPSGAACTIRKMKAADFLAFGRIPELFAAANRTGKKPDPEKMTPEDITWFAKLGARILTHCVGPLTMDGQTVRIVDKPWADCAEGEIAIEELEQGDANAIATAVKEFSGAGKEGAEEARTFPEQPAASGESPSPGTGVPEVPNGCAGPGPG